MQNHMTCTQGVKTPETEEEREIRLALAPYLAQGSALIERRDGSCTLIRPGRPSEPLTLLRLLDKAADVRTVVVRVGRPWPVEGRLRPQGLSARQRASWHRVNRWSKDREASGWTYPRRLLVLDEGSPSDLLGRSHACLWGQRVATQDLCRCLECRRALEARREAAQPYLDAIEQRRLSRQVMSAARVRVS